MVRINEPHASSVSELSFTRNTREPAASVGGWGSNPRPADYEKYGPVHRAHHLHEYHGAMPPAALIALFAPMARSTNRSTHSMVITGCRLP